MSEWNGNAFLYLPRDWIAALLTFSWAIKCHMWGMLEPRASHVQITYSWMKEERKSISNQMIWSSKWDKMQLTEVCD